MFENLSERLNNTLKTISGKGRLSDDNMKDTLREIRMALLEADVALPVVKTLIQDIREAARGQEIKRNLNAGQALVKLVNDQLVAIMGEKNDQLNLQAQPPVVILMAGLQGSGKTTTTAKLGRYLVEREKKKVLVGSADIYRPAAIAQLETLAAEVGVDFFPSAVDQKPADIARQLIKHAEQQFYDVVILDTAGRWHVDAEMMSEIKALHQQINPTETLFVVDSMTGQEAANTAKSFDEALDLTGIILTKVDGDARGGAALSIRHVTGKPIKFLGVGEKTTALEPFHPERIASRILGMGDILSLIEAAEQKVDQKKAAKLAKKMKQGDGFDLEDFRDQIKQMTAMGGVNSLLDKLPGAGKLPQTAHNKFNDQQFGKMEAIINSMTVQERRFPANIRGSQKRRIAAGSGTQIPDVNRLLKQFEQMQKTMKKMGRKGNVKKMMRNLESANLFPPGMGL